MNYLKSALACLAIATLGACSGNHNGWKVNGNVANAPEGEKIAVDGFSNAGWYNIDSVSIADNGYFAFQAPKGAPYPNVYRLSLGGRCIYFPIDSIESVYVEADGSAFDSNYKLSGSDLAASMQLVDNMITSRAALIGAEGVVNDMALKNELVSEMLADTTGVVSYYLLNKTIGGMPLFGTDNRADVRVLGAVANKFATLRPNDPRTQYLTDRYLRARRELSDVATIIAADPSGLLDIELYDEAGKKQALSQIAANAGATLLSFTIYDSEPSLAYNVELNRMLEKYGSKGLAIYQVAFDDNEVEWAKSARNLPWITVRNNPVDGDKLLRLYNIGAVPMTYLIDGNGDLVERIEDPANLDLLIQKYLK